MKQELSDLAICSGTPLFDSPLHVGRPSIVNRRRLMARIDDILDREWLTNNGPYVQELEQKIVEYLAVKHCVAMCNGTVALEIASRALGFRGEVILPSFTFIATAHALQWQEITPVFCDVGSATHHLDPAQVEDMITPRTSGIVGVHVWGQACDVEAIDEIARRHHLRVLYDAAHAFGCSYRGQMIGGFGDAEVFSFHATKFFNTFEGGAITTNDDDLAEQVRFMRNFGFAGYDDVQYIGTNGKMSEVSAAMGLTMFEDLNGIIETNYRHYKQYQQTLADLAGVKMFAYNEDEKFNYQYIILEIDEEAAGISRDILVKVLHAENVLARRYFYPGCHQMEPYRSYFPHAGLILPNTNRLTQRVMSLPTGTAVSDSDVGRICDLIRFVVKHGPAISQRQSQSDHG